MQVDLEFGDHRPVESVAVCARSCRSLGFAWNQISGTYPAAIPVQAGSGNIAVWQITRGSSPAVSGGSNVAVASSDPMDYFFPTLSTDGTGGVWLNVHGGDRVPNTAQYYTAVSPDSAAFTRIVSVR